MNKWDLTGFVTASSYRSQVVEALSGGEKTPTELSDETGIKIEHTSRALSQLKHNGLVTLAVPESQTKPRPYELTEKGREIAENLEAVMDR